ncbi:type VI secretion system tube protein TssD [Dysgonomonas sp. ZJ709]|uniref:type VI secretion system tube protein TssD n=1 Tax=Dysgonomonas sp. ZJ709 TaxID=2709797 RepID=UPI0013ECC144|nr:type VI secretion system tube protein TssD [Dysgonomonas sp. ZJ709]
MLDNIDKLFNFPHIDSNVTVWFCLDGKEYEVEQFRIGFSQPTDDKGEPETETMGGQVMIILSETVPESIYDWVLKSGIKKNGQIVFKTQTSNAPLRVQFFNASCINFTRTVNGSGGLQTNLILSPERLMINDVEHDNFWVE